MNKNIKTFIEKNKNLIEEDDWEEIYGKICEPSDALQVGELTRTLLNANINPLDYLDYIPDYFLYNSSIKGFKIPDSVTIIGDYAFAFCSSLTSITIGKGVYVIGEYAFRYCDGLTSITIPDSVTSIRKGAFYLCSGLARITFGGTKAQWQAIKKSTDWKKYSAIEIIHCKDGDIKLN